MGSAAGAGVFAQSARNLTIYDAAYLELAQRRRLALATLDDALRAAARDSGVELLGRAPLIQIVALRPTGRRPYACNRQQPPRECIPSLLKQMAFRYDSPYRHIVTMSLV
jgi:hypothetical protein